MADKNIYKADDLIGEFHDASMCTFDGRECYVASICWGKKILDTFETSSRDDALAWVLQQLRKRTGLEPECLGK